MNHRFLPIGVLLPIFAYISAWSFNLDGAEIDPEVVPLPTYYPTPTFHPTPPDNNRCANAVEIFEGETRGGDTTEATNDGDASCGDAGDSSDVWYFYTPRISGKAVFSLCGSNYDTVLSIHTGCTGTRSNQLACNDDAGASSDCAGEHQSEISLMVINGTTYWIRIAGFEGGEGLYRLHIDGPTPIPVAAPPKPLQIYGMGWVNSVAFLPDGQHVAASGFSSIDFYNISGSRSRFFSASTDAINAMALSPNGALMVTAHGRFDSDRPGGLARLWDVATGEVLKTFEGHTSSLTSVAFSPDGARFVTGSDDRTAIIWDIATGSAVRTLAGHSLSVTGVAYSPDGTRILTGGFDKQARLWDVATGSVFRTFLGHTQGLNNVAFSPDGSQIVTTSYGDETARQWETATATLIRSFTTGEGMSCAIYSPNGAMIVTASYPYNGVPALHLWNAQTGALIRTMSGHISSVGSMDFSPDGSKLVTGASGENSFGFRIAVEKRVRIWDVGSGQEIRAYSQQLDAVSGVDFSPTGAFMATSASRDDDPDDYLGRIWDTASGQIYKVLGGHEGWLTSIDVSPDGTRVVTSSYDKSARVWDPITGELKFVINHANAVLDAEYSPDGSMIATTDGTNVALWTSASGGSIRQFAGDSIVWSPDGSKMLTSSDDNAVMRRVSTGAQILDYDTELRPIAFAPDGETVILGNVVYGASDDELILTLPVPEPVCGAFSPDGSRIAMGFDDGVTRVMDAQTGRVTQIISGHYRDVFAIAFHPDGDKVLTGAWDQTAKLWGVRTEIFTPTPTPAPTPSRNQIIDAMFQRILQNAEQDLNHDGVIDAGDLIRALLP